MYRCGNGEVFPQKYPEIVADATNSLALHIADMRRKEQLPAAKPGCFCTVHRHVRSQEIKGLMQAFQSLFKEVFKVEEIRWKLQQRGGYEGVQFKMIIDLAGRECEIADGR